MDFYSASSLKKQSADRHVAPLGYIILIPSQSVFVFLVNAACVEEKQHIPILYLGFDPIGARTHDIPHSRPARHYTTDVVSYWIIAINTLICRRSNTSICVQIDGKLQSEIVK